VKKFAFIFFSTIIIKIHCFIELVNLFTKVVNLFTILVNF